MVRTDLTDAMKARIAKVTDHSKLEAGAEGDDTRLINSWKQATASEKEILLELYKNHYHKDNWKGTANKYKQAKYETLGCFTDYALRNAVNNLKKSEDAAKKKAAESMSFRRYLLSLLFCSVTIVSHSFVPFTSGRRTGRSRWQVWKRQHEGKDDDPHCQASCCSCCRGVPCCG
jgi:hypothetical protein